MDAFKNLLNAALVRSTGTALARHAKTFDRKRFETLALAGLDNLEMKARAMQIADALEATLPARFDDACRVIEAALAAPIAMT
jgi:hypothetical protein